MAFPSVTNTFVESSTAYATAVNQNFLDVVNGVSDGTKDIRVNDATVQGTLTLSNALASKTILPSVADTYDLGSAAGAWNNVWMNQLSVETALVSAAGHVAFRAVGNYVNSDQANYLDLHAVTQVRVNAPAQVAGSFVVSGALSASGSGTFGGAFSVVGSGTIGGGLDVTGDSVVSGAVNITGSATVGGYLNVNSNLVTKDVYPVSHNTYVLGDLTHQYKHAWFASASIDAALVMNSINGGGVKFYDGNNYITNPALGEINIVAAGGSGVIRLGGTVTTRSHTPEADGTYDIGANASSRYRDVWVSRNVQVYGAVVLNSGSKLTTDSNGFHYVSGSSNALHIYGLNAINIEGYSSGAINVFGAPTNFYGATVQFNSDAGTADLSVHGDTVNDALFVDASANKVGVLTSAPSQALGVSGTIAATNIIFHSPYAGSTPLSNVNVGSFTCQMQGIATATNLVTFNYYRVGKLCTLYYLGGAAGVSTAATWSIPTASWPTACIPKNEAASDYPICMYLPAHAVDDNGASAAAAIAVDADRLYFLKDNAADYSPTAWTASGTKQLWHKVAITYQTD